MADRHDDPPADGITRIPLNRLTRMMVEGENKEVLKYLRSLPKNECTEVKEQLIKNLEALQSQQPAKPRPSENPRDKKPHGTSGRSSGRRDYSVNSTKKPPSKTSEKPQASTPPTATGVNGNKLNFKIIVSENTENKKEERPQVGDYVWKKDLGRGMFGLVYKAVHQVTSKVVAIKEIDTEVIPHDKLPGVLKEAELMAKLDHPNIVQIFEVLQGKKKVFFVLEYINRGSLMKLVKSVGTLSENLAAPITRQTLEGLQFLHGQNPPIIHRDIKCANLLINSSGVIKLADFGTAKEDVGKNVTVIGTPFWMAPEIIEVAGASAISDVWSLGCTIIEMLTGEPPYFNLSTMQALFMIVEEQHPPVPDNISEPLSHFLNPQKRPSASILLDKHPWITNQGSKDKDRAYGPLVEAIQMFHGTPIATPNESVPASLDWQQAQKLMQEGGKKGESKSLRVKGDAKQRGAITPDPKRAGGSRGRAKSPEELEIIIKLVVEERDRLVLENTELKAQLELLKKQNGIN